MQMHFLGGPAKNLAPCTVLEPENDNNRHQHKGVQCDMSNVTVHVATGTSTEQPLVGVAVPELSLVGVEDNSSDSDCDLLHASINRVSEPLNTSLFCGWTPEQLRLAQESDPDIAPVRRWMEEKGSRPSYADVAHCSPASKTYWTQWKRLYQKQGVLLRKNYCTEGKTFYPQILLPHIYRNSVMEQMHDGPVGGHFGVERTLTRLRTRYFWYNMKDDVTLWCRTCPSCAARARPKKTPQAAMGTVRVGAPMERIAVDLMGPLNETDRHNRYILVVQDYFSKWVEAYPVPNEQASTVAEKIASEWVCRYGAPLSLHSDQDTNFESAVFQGMCEAAGDRQCGQPGHAVSQ
ncbi:hypothetical protein L3Q82_003886 [Scortum barcoo]|uniref:Uncharacterized protein n=1 Tax=Scortum barcoo TaxID=214431 RepID=A0ACB8X657_9TELE|nr:hypothetical protein L3Q82_003886 [Scortum barcoo]